MSKKADFVADNLTIVNPRLASEVSPKSPFKAEELTRCSNRKIPWVCKSGHEWVATVVSRTGGSKCPYCSGRKPIAGVNDLATVNPKLASEVSPNSPFKAEELLKWSNRKIPWVCKNGHEWVASVNSRTRGNGCPYCAGKKPIVGETDLATVNPKLASEVSPNSKIKATEVTAGSHEKLLWRCEKNHEWLAITNNRARGYGCPYCAGRTVLPGFNDLATVNPKLASEISPRSEIKAAEVTEFSAKKPLWRCSKNHEWSVSVANRSNGYNCPYCDGQKPIPGINDLATTNPDLARQISPNSKIKASELMKGSHRSILWKCKRDHEWLSPVYSRAAGRGCPYCSNQRILKGFNDLATTNPELAKQVSPNSKFKATEIAASSNRRILWRCEKGHEWEVSASNRAQGCGCPYCGNKKVLKGFNDLATTHSDLAKQVSPNSKIKADEIVAKSEKKLLWRCPKNHQWKATVSARERGRNCPYCSNKRLLVGYNDLATTQPELAKQVSPRSKFKANEVMAGTEKRLIWRCEKDHEWEARGADRTSDKGCPYCSGRVPVVGVNDLATVNPALASEISPNSKIKATELTEFSNRQVLWCCKQGHEWRARPSTRSRGAGCPQCAGSKPERDLAELVKSLLSKDIKVLRNDRKVIKPYELDILVPELNLAFEFNGIYWHSDKMIRARKSSFPSSKAFDDFKKKECAKQGIKLFFVREKQWIENHENEVKRVSEIVNQANGS